MAYNVANAYVSYIKDEISCSPNEISQAVIFADNCNSKNEATSDLSLTITG